MGFESAFIATTIKLTLGLALQMTAQKNHLTLEDCQSGDSKSCAQTIRYLKDSCNNKGAKSCGVLGYIYEGGYGVSVNLKSAIAYYKRACDLRYGVGCVNLGVIYAKVENYKDANSYFARACEMRNAEGCLNLGISYLYGYGVSVGEIRAKLLFREARQYYIESCNKQNALDCKSVAQFYKDGIGIEIDEKIAEIYQKKACELDENLCE